ncbi:MAG: DUF3226 domain-containing protein [Maioricimonas sp. JB049]
MTQRRATLHVEGKDDLFTIVHLLERHAIDCDERSRKFDIKTSSERDPAGTESVDALLDGMDLAIRQSRGVPVGFVVDADWEGVSGGLKSRWQAVCDRLRAIGAASSDLPKKPPPDGLIINVPKYRARAGVWLMPDNQRDGMLEDFLQELIADGDPLIDHAIGATAEATSLGAEFPEVHRTKAELHAWLAWQEKPGQPYGIAIKARYFSHDSPAALAFVDWIRRLFDIPE